MLVIRIGRRRRCARPRPPPRPASDRPLPRPALANSTIRIAFFAARPISTMRPIWVRMLLSIPRKMHARASPQAGAIGTIRMIASGSTQAFILRRRAPGRRRPPRARRRYRPCSPVPRFCWKAMPGPVRSAVSRGQQFEPASFSIARRAAAPGRRHPPPDVAIDRVPRHTGCSAVTSAGPLRSWTSMRVPERHERARRRTGRVRRVKRCRPRSRRIGLHRPAPATLIGPAEQR